MLFVSTQNIFKGSTITLKSISNTSHHSITSIINSLIPFLFINEKLLNKIPTKNKFHIFWVVIWVLAVSKAIKMYDHIYEKFIEINYIFRSTFTKQTVLHNTNTISEEPLAKSRFTNILTRQSLLLFAKHNHLFICLLPFLYFPCLNFTPDIIKHPENFLLYATSIPKFIKYLF